MDGKERAGAINSEGGLTIDGFVALEWNSTLFKSEEMALEYIDKIKGIVTVEPSSPFKSSVGYWIVWWKK